MRRGAAVVAAAGLLGMVLAGCGTGQDAATADTLSSIPGVNADQEGIAVRNARLAFSEEGYPAGGDAPVELWVFNQSAEPVRLVGISSEAAASASLTGVELVGETASPAPTGPGAQPELELAPGEHAAVDLQLSGLTESMNGTGSLPLTLTFTNDAVFALDLPMATPDRPLPREPMDLEGDEGH